MSHFTVMVFGDNPDELLSSFDENIIVNEYETGIVEEDEIKIFKDFYIEKNLSIPELYKLHGKDWNNNNWKFKGNDIINYSTYNPKSKWDWYQFGGRWNGFFKLKKGSPEINIDLENRANSAYKKDIDVEGMRKEKENAASIIYDKAKHLIDKFGEGFIPFKDFTQNRKKDYHDQPLIKAFRENRDDFGFMIDVEQFFASKEKYLEDARNDAICPFAFINTKGEWVEKGNMGWWACVSNKKENWSKIFNDYFDSLPDDTMIHLVDCHI